MEFERLVIDCGCTRKAFEAIYCRWNFRFVSFTNHLDWDDKSIHTLYSIHTPTFFMPLIAYSGRLCSALRKQRRYVFIYDFAFAFLQPSISNDAFEFMENFTAAYHLLWWSPIHWSKTKSERVCVLTDVRLRKMCEDNNTSIRRA